MLLESCCEEMSKESIELTMSDEVAPVLLSELDLLCNDKYEVGEVDVLVRKDELVDETWLDESCKLELKLPVMS